MLLKRERENEKREQNLNLNPSNLVPRLSLLSLESP